MSTITPLGASDSGSTSRTTINTNFTNLNDDKAETLADLGVTASIAEVNVLDGIPATLTATELGYVDGVTSAIQTQLNTKAPTASPTFTGTVTVPVGGITGHTKFLYKAANETVNGSSTLQNDDDLVFAVGANEAWEFRLVLYPTVTENSGIKFAFSFPTAATAYIRFDGENYIETDTIDYTAINFTGTENIFIEAVSTVFVGANAGNVQFRWAQSTSFADNTVMKKGSHIIATRLV